MGAGCIAALLGATFLRLPKKAPPAWRTTARRALNSTTPGVRFVKCEKFDGYERTPCGMWEPCHSIWCGQHLSIPAELENIVDEIRERAQRRRGETRPVESSVLSEYELILAAYR